MSVTNVDPDDDSYRLDQPVDDGFGNLTHEIPESVAEATSMLAALHPPTNGKVIVRIITYWTDVSGYNDPIVQSASSWLCYLLNDDVSQFDAGMTTEQHQRFEERIEELGLPDPE